MFGDLFDVLAYVASATQPALREQKNLIIQDALLIFPDNGF